MRAVTLIVFAGSLLLAGCGGSGSSEEDAVAQIKKLGGKVKVDNEGRVTTVTLGERDVGDAKMGLLKPLPSVRVLDLRGTNITDTGLANIAGLTQLQTLELHNNKDVGDAGMAHLAALTKLKVLKLGMTSVGDAGLAHLAGLTQLQTLDLDKTPVTDAGMAHLKGLTQLTVLRLNDTAVTDAGLEHLKGMTKLKDLFVQDAKVSEEGAETLKKTLGKVQINR